MTVTLDLYTVTRKTSFSDAVQLLCSIETASKAFNRIKARRSFVVGCLSACGFDYKLNFASRFSNISNISADCRTFRLIYSCSFGMWNSCYCIDIDISKFN